MSARSINSTSSSALWITTSTDSGIFPRSIERESTRASLVRSGRSSRVAQPDMQLAQLLLVDSARRVGQQVLRTLRFRERDHVALRFGAGHQHHEAVEADRDAAVRRRAVLQRVEQEAKLELRLFRVDL